MKFRNWDGRLMDRGDAEELMKARGLEVAHDTFQFDGQTVLVRSMLQPTFHSPADPLFLTMVFGDAELGLQEFGTSSEGACRKFHRSLVDRYLLLENERQSTPRVLLDGVL